MPLLPRLPAKVVRFHWEEVSHLDGRRSVPVVDAQAETEDGPVKVALEVLPGSLEVRRYAGAASPRVAILAEDAAQAFVDERREKVRTLFGGAAATI
jgi:hypothetical protein